MQVLEIFAVSGCPDLGENLLRPAFESSRKHLNFPDCATTGDIQGAFLRTTEGKALAVLIVARHADDAEVFTLGTEDLNAGSGQRIKAAFAVDDETICASYDSWKIIRTFTSAFVNRKFRRLRKVPSALISNASMYKPLVLFKKQG